MPGRRVDDEAAATARARLVRSVAALRAIRRCAIASPSPVPGWAAVCGSSPRTNSRKMRAAQLRAARPGPRPRRRCTTRVALAASARIQMRRLGPPYLNAFESRFTSTCAERAALASTVRPGGTSRAPRAPRRPGAATRSRARAVSTTSSSGCSSSSSAGRARLEAAEVEHLLDERRQARGLGVEQLEGAARLAPSSARPRRSVSTSMRMPVSGVRSSCDTLETKSCCRRV